MKARERWWFWFNLSRLSEVTEGLNKEPNPRVLTSSKSICPCNSSSLVCFSSVQACPLCILLQQKSKFFLHFSCKDWHSASVSFVEVTVILVSYDTYPLFVFCFHINCDPGKHKAKKKKLSWHFLLTSNCLEGNIWPRGYSSLLLFLSSPVHHCSKLTR